MKCEKCGKNEANVYYKETVNGVTREMHLCSDCAEKENISAAFETSFPSIEQFWNDPFHSFFGGGFSSLLSDMLPAPKMLSTKRICPTCGMTEQQLQQTGRVGCADCYKTFADMLNPYMQKIHGADRHIGTSPASQQPQEKSPVEALQAQLKQAIAEENYEQAAKLRDEIRRIGGK